FGLLLPLDPGQYTITVQAPGYEAVDYSVRLEEGDEKSYTVAPGEPVEDPVDGATGPTIVMREDGNTEQTLAYVFGGLGTAAVVGGAVFGLMAYSNQKKIEEDCTGTFCTTAEGPQAANDGVRNALLADVL